MLLVAPGGHVHYTAFRKCRKTHSFRQLDKSTHTFKCGIPKPNSKFRGGFGFKCKEINVNWIFWNWRFWFGFVADGCLDARPASASPGPGDQ